MKKEIAIIKFKIIAVFFLILLVVALTPIHSDFTDYSIEENCALKLEALGATQLAYQDSNLNKNFAQFSTLIDTGYLDSDTTVDNYIKNYRLDYIADTQTIYA